MGMKVYEVLFDEKQDAGVYALSCVEDPAMQDRWLTLADHPKEIQFSAVDEEKHLLLGAALIPNKKIYRKDENGEYYITFSGDTIEKCAHSFVRNGYVNNSTENHKVELNGVSVVQSWIVEDPEKDKSAIYGKKYEKGTWVTMMKVDNEETWDKAKNGTLNGFSIDGLFSLKELNLNKNDKEFVMDKKSLRETILEALSLSKKEEVKLGTLMLKDGKTKVEFEGEEPKIGEPIFLMVEAEGEETKKEPMPEGKHELESGEFLHVDKNGLVAEAPVEEEKEDEKEVVAELAEILKEYDAKMSKKIDGIKAELKAEFNTQLEAEKKKSKDLEAKLSEQEKKNKELEDKLEKEPAAEKIVKTELMVEKPRNAKQRLLNVALEALNKN